MTQRQQARRQRAYERFSLDEKRAAKDPKYAERKLTELASLQASLKLQPTV